MIENIKNTVIALEALNIPSRLKAVEDRPFGISMGGGSESAGLASPVQDADIASAVTWNSKQAGDATLTALAAYNTNGLLTQTAADTFTGRTITGTTDVISVSNGNGVSGNPTLTIAGTYVGQTSITTLGTIATGTWNALFSAGIVTTAALAAAAVTPAKLGLGQDTATVATEETTTSTSYTDLATDGPTITYVPGVNTIVLLIWSGKVFNANSETSFMGVDVSGATTSAVSDTNAASMRAPAAVSNYITVTGFRILTLTSGSNTIKAKYKVSGGTGAFINRTLVMIPLG